MTIAVQDVIVTLAAAVAAAVVLRRVAALFRPARSKPQPLRFIRPSSPR